MSDRDGETPRIQGRNGPAGPWVTLLALAEGAEVLRRTIPPDPEQANDVLAAAEARAADVVAVLPGPATGGTEPVDRALAVLGARPAVGAVAASLFGGEAGVVPGRGRPSITQLADRFRVTTDGDRGSVLVARLAPVVAIGGFDPTVPGLGLADLVARLAIGGWEVDGVALDALPFVDGLHGGLEVRERFEADATWLARYEHRAGRLGPRRPERPSAWFRAATLAATRLAARRDPTAGTAAARAWAAVRADARVGWRTETAQDSQVGIGHRADWRFVLPLPPGGRWDHTLIDDGSQPAAWQWLVDDAWTGRVSTTPDPTDPADLVVIGPGRPVGPALAAAAPGATICLLRARARPGRASIAGPNASDALPADRVTVHRRYFAWPDVDRPTRLVPRDHPAGAAWLAEHLPGPLATIGSTDSIDPSEGGGWRARVGTTVAAGLGRVAAAGLGRVVAAGLGHRAAGLAGGSITVGVANQAGTAGPAGPLGVETGPLGLAPDAIVVTSGFDEGSRAVLLPLPAPSAWRTGPHRPERVTKVAPRPRYDDNVHAEQAVLEALTARLDRAGRSGDLVPRPLGTMRLGPLAAADETFAGPRTAAQVLNEQRTVEARVATLERILGAIGDFGAATRAGTLTWDDDAFDANVGGWFDRLAAIAGPSTTLDAYRAALAERSAALRGRSLPLVARHYDLGPWNIALEATEAMDPGPSPVTLIDWELVEWRSVDRPSLAGTDQIYFTKYWLHIALGHPTAAGELRAFPWPDPAGTVGDNPRPAAATALGAAQFAAGVDPGFVPLLEANVWAEAACYTSTRRADRGGDPGSPYRYLRALARNRVRALGAWPLTA